MAFVDDLVVLYDNSTKLTAGTNLFKHVTPETSTRAAFVYEYPGLTAVDRFSGTLPAMTRPRAQITVRSTKSVGGEGLASSTGARVLAQDLWELSHAANTTVNSQTYQRIVPLQDPFFLRHDEAGRAVFAFNVQALRTATTQA